MTERFLKPYFLEALEFVCLNFLAFSILVVWLHNMANRLIYCYVWQQLFWLDKSYTVNIRATRHDFILLTVPELFFCF